MSTQQKFTTNDLRLIAGVIREIDADLFVPLDVVHVLLLFWANGDVFDERYSNNKIIITKNDDKKYGSSFQQIVSGCGSFEPSKISKNLKDIQTAFGVQEVSRGLKYTWNVTICPDSPDKDLYIGIIESKYIKTIHKNENYDIPYITANDYFFSSKYNGYGLCVKTGDVYHSNAKYGKPYILNDMDGDNNMIILIIELDLTGKFYGSLRFLTHQMNAAEDCTQYWNNDVIAYDDILVHRKYHLAVVMETGASLILFDDNILREKYRLNKKKIM